MSGRGLGAFRQNRGIVSLALLVALVIPLLAGLLPQPALSAEAALARDIVASRCQPGEEPGQPGMDHQSRDCCILCSAAAAPVTAPDLSQGIAATPRRALPRLAGVAEDPAPPRIPFYDSDLSLRGPPASL